MLPDKQTLKILFQETFSFARKPTNFIIPSALISALGLALSAYAFFHNLVIPFLLITIVGTTGILAFTLYRVAQQPEEEDKLNYTRKLAPFNFSALITLVFCIIMLGLKLYIGNPDQKIDLVIQQTSELPDRTAQAVVTNLQKSNLFITFEQHTEYMQAMEKNLLASLQNGNAQNRIDIEGKLSVVQAALSNDEALQENYSQMQRLLTDLLDSLEKASAYIPEKYYRPAQYALQHADFIQAKDVYKKMLQDRSAPTEARAEASYQLGQIGIQEAIYVTAMEYFKTASELHPNKAQYAIWLCRSSADMGKNEITAKSCGRTIEISETNINLLKRTLPEGDPKILAAEHDMAVAKAYLAFNAGSTAMNTRSKKAALEHLEHAINLFSYIEPVPYDDLASTYRMYAFANGMRDASEPVSMMKESDIEPYEKKILYLEKAVETWLKIYPETHPYIRSAQHDINFTRSRIDTFKNPPSESDYEFPVFETFEDRSPYSKKKD